jgi:hypothetical protein
MLEVVCPYLASIGIHKNGTWAAQKIIDTARSSAQVKKKKKKSIHIACFLYISTLTALSLKKKQIALICSNIEPYVPALLLDQFGNYVVQCCLGLGPTRNQFIFDAIVTSCWDIAQGRFGARAVRATLESPHVTKRQQVWQVSLFILRVQIA